MPLTPLLFCAASTLILFSLIFKCPGSRGLLLSAASHPPAVIFTTAYREYAVEGFELEAADYLVKPVLLERFLKAVQKLLRQQVAPPLSEATAEEPYVYYRVDRQQVKVFLKDILWIEAKKITSRLYWQMINR